VERHRQVVGHGATISIVYLRGCRASRPSPRPAERRGH
jgi:hypothetical protein